MKAKQEVIVQEREKQLAKKLKEKEREIERELEAKQAEKKKQKQQIQALSFKLDEEEEYSDKEEIVSFLMLKSFGHLIKKCFLIQSIHPSVKTVVIKSEPIDETEENEPVKKKAKGNKNPDVDTSFLPDRDREEEENKLREELRQVHTQDYIF